MDNQNFHYLYRHFDKDGNLLYVGISLCYIIRLSQHKSQSSWFPNIASSVIEKFNSRFEAEIAETNAIESEHPLCNVVHNRKKKKTIQYTKKIYREQWPVSVKIKKEGKKKFHKITMDDLGLETEREWLVLNEFVELYNVKFRKTKIADGKFTYNTVLPKGIGEITNEEQRQVIRKVHFHQHNAFMEEMGRQKEIRQELKLRDEIGSF